MPTPSRRSTRPRLEALEARDLPATFHPVTADELVRDVASANASPEADTIVLAAGATYTLTASNNATYGPTGLPVVAATTTIPGPSGPVTRPSGPLTIVGNGAVIERSDTPGAPAFRLLAVEPGAKLNAKDLTLEGGRAYEGNSRSGMLARGGAVLNLGALDLSGVIVQDNTAEGSFDYYSNGATAAGGGIYSDGTLAVRGGVIRNNQVWGARGGPGYLDRGGAGGNGMAGGRGLGGGLYIGGGTAALDGVTLEANRAHGGAGGAGWSRSYSRSSGFNGGAGGSGRGGGLHAAGGTMTLTDCKLKNNDASGGAGGSAGWRGRAGADGVGEGGGIYVAAGVAADWDADTSIARNTASTRKPNVCRA